MSSSRLTLFYSHSFFVQSSSPNPAARAEPLGRLSLRPIFRDAANYRAIDGAAFIQPHAQSAVVSTSSHKITVERERVLLDGTEIGKLPAAAARVELRVAAGQLTVTADGAPITTEKLSK